jgi:HK97 family phage portal protein
MLVDGLVSLFGGGSRLVGARSIENPNIPLDALADEWSDGEPTWTGVRVNRETALTISAIWRGVNLVSRDVAKMGLHVLRRTSEAESGRERAKDHPAYQLVRRRPNQEMTAFVFWQTLVGHALLEGNGYAYIARRGDMSPEELIPLLPDRTAPARIAGGLYYRTIVNNQGVTIPARDVLHIRGYSYDGLLGYNVVERMKQMLGWQIGMRKYSAKFYTNGARASGVLMTPGRMRGDAATNLLKSFEKENAGLDKVGRTILLEEGAKYIPITITQAEAQFLESIEAGLVDVANCLGVAPHKVGHPGRTSYNSLEMENQSYLDEAIDPWAVNIEQECDEKLLTEEQKLAESHFHEFNRNALVRVDYSTKQTGLKMRIESGQISPDEARAANNEGPREDGLGGKYWMPSNMQYADRAAQAKDPPEDQPAGDPPTDPPDDDEEEEAFDRQQLDAALLAVLDQAAGRAVTWLANKTRNALRSEGKLLEWLRELEGADTLRVIVAEISPAARAAILARGGNVYRAAQTAAKGITSDLYTALMLDGAHQNREAVLATWEAAARQKLIYMLLEEKRS